MPKITDKERVNLKAQYPEGLIIVSLKEEQNKPAEDFVFKKPTMVTVSAAAVFEEKDPVRSNQIVFNDCLVWGEKEAANDPDRFLSIAPYLKNLVKVRQVEVGEL